MAPTTLRGSSQRGKPRAAAKPIRMFGNLVTTSALTAIRSVGTCRRGTGNDIARGGRGGPADGFRRRPHAGRFRCCGGNMRHERHRSLESRRLTHCRRNNGHSLRCVPERLGCRTHREGTRPGDAGRLHQRRQRSRLGIERRSQKHHARKTLRHAATDPCNFTVAK